MTLTTQEFRSNPEFVSHMRRLFEEDVIFQMALEVMDGDTENPVNRTAPPEITPHGAYILLGEQTGYRQFQTRFLMLGKGIEPQLSDGEPSYAEPEKPEET